MFALLLVVAGIGLIAIAAYSWRYRHKPAAQTFALLMASITHWLLCIAGWSFSPTPETAIFWLWFQFLGVGSVPPLLFRYVLQFTGQGERLTLRRYLMLWIVPTITQPLAWTNSAHQLIFTSVRFASRGDLMVLEAWQAGPWFIVHSAYSFALVGVSLVIMGRSISKSAPNIFRRQLLLLILASIPALVLTLLNTLQIIAPDEISVPLSFVLFGGALVWAILREGMINTIPIARDLVIEQMEDGMLVIDQHDQIIDLNPAMQQLLDQRANDLLGKPIAVGLAHLPTLLHAIEHAPTDIEVPLHQHPQFYEVRVRPLIQRGVTAGKVCYFT
ncbi:MAG: hypothetical protein Fur005_41150 [Roseiflexaceae bacterium]